MRGNQTSFMLWRAHRHSPDHPALRDRNLDANRHKAPNAMYGLIDEPQRL